MLSLEGSHPSLYIPTVFYLHNFTKPMMRSESPAHHRHQNPLLNVKTNTTLNKIIGIRKIPVSLITVTRWDVLTTSYSFSRYIQRFFFFNGDKIPLSNTLWVCVYFALHCQVSLQNSLQIQMMNGFHLVCPSSIQTPLHFWGPVWCLP